MTQILDLITLVVNPKDLNRNRGARKGTPIFIYLWLPEYPHLCLFFYLPAMKSSTVFAHRRERRGSLFNGVPRVNQAKGCLLWGERSAVRKRYTSDEIAKSREN